MRVLSGVQSNGKLHLGNWLGAMKQHVDGQDVHESFIFIANFHALNALQDRQTMRERTVDVALDYLAMGLDPAKACLFRQSDVPEVTELTWILGTVTGKGLMDRATSYKDKVAKGITPNVGLYTYPILMAADILIYRSDLVPVGKDQLQHVEFAQDMATYFNEAHGVKLLKRPEAKLNEAPIVPGIDGQKMSKSYGNAIGIFDPPAVAKKRIMSIVTDSTPVEAPKDPDRDNVFAIYRLIARPDEVAALRERYVAGGMGYGDAKKALLEVFERTFAAARERRAELAARPGDVEEILAAGGRKARAIAVETMREVRDACGLMVSAP